jgi:hypothetical protein
MVDVDEQHLATCHAVPPLSSALDEPKLLAASLESFQHWVGFTDARILGSGSI